MEEEAIILKEHVKDAIEISKLIVEKDLEGKKLSQVEDAEKNRDIYYEFISTALQDYKSKYNNMSPNMVMNDFLRRYMKKNKLNNYLSKGLKFYGQKLVSYEWACIYKGDPSVKKKHYSYSPQLFILINSKGIKFGFCYGTEVNNEDEIVEIIREDDEIRDILLSVFQRNHDLKFYLEGDAEDLPNEESLLEIQNSEDLEINWNEKTHAVSYFLEDAIPDNISDLIEQTFDDLLELFKKSSLLEIEDTLENQCIEILKKKVQKHPELNYDKILEINGLIIEKLKNLNIERSPSIIIFTATVIWHNVLNRPNDNQYLMQEDLNNFFDGGLNAVRYLRKDLGVESRVYNNLEDFIKDLNKDPKLGTEYARGLESFPNWEIVRHFIEKVLIGKSKPNQAIIEASTFLYFNNGRSFKKNELWDATSPYIEYTGDTPFASFNAELSKYSDNSDIQRKHSPLLFTIKDPDARIHELQLLESIRERINGFLGASEQKPFVWQMIKQAAENLGSEFSISDIKDYITKKYEEVNENTINAQIIVCTVNHDSRIHYPENKKPRISNLKYDFLYRIEKGRGILELYDPEKHGIWEIRENENGVLKVVQLTQKQDKSLKYVYNDLSLLMDIKEALLSKGQIILMGPPGTSKSYLAEQIAIEISKGKGDNIKLVQFHPSYSYEDFVECNVIENSEIKPKEKIFRKFCKKAIDGANLEDNFVLIIDEINRGNVERIFGELIYGLERRNTKIPTVYFEDEITIPDNLYIIGTMNTVDLSIANIDAALRRRFYIIEIEPKKIILKNWLNYYLGEQYLDFQKDLVEFMEKLNEKIETHELMGKYRTIGHAVFMLNAIKEKYDFNEIRKNLEMEWKYMIRPTILEYLNFPDEEELKQFDAIFEEFSNKEYNI